MTFWRLPFLQKILVSLHFKKGSRKIIYETRLQKYSEKLLILFVSWVQLKFKEGKKLNKL